MTDIVELIRDNRIRDLRDRLLAMTEAERGEIGRELPGRVKELRADLADEMLAGEDPDWEVEWETGVEIDDMLDSRAAALLLAGLGTITGPAAVVSYVTSRDVNRRWGVDVNLADAVQIAETRPIEWRRDVATRLARRIRRPDDRFAPLAVALLRSSDAEPPDHDPLVTAWLRMMTHPADPLTARLLPRIFVAEGAGRELRDERLTPAPTRWLARVRNELPRDQAIDGCVSRFLRGGEAQDLRFFVRLHDLLDPTAEETAGRLRDYLRLLPAAPGTVAELAAKQVKRLFPIDRADLVEAVEALVFRQEAKLAMTGLRWLDAELKRTPSAAEEFVPALVTAYGHTSFDVQAKAAFLTIKHVPDGSLVADAIESLPSGLNARLAAHYRGEKLPEEPRPVVTFPPLPEVAAPRPFPEPTISTSIEATRAWTTAERWLAAFVTRATGDREALREELHRRQDRTRWSLRPDVWTDPRDWIKALSAELITPGATTEQPKPMTWQPDAHHDHILIATKRRRKADPTRWTFTGDIVAFSADPEAYAPSPHPNTLRALPATTRPHTTQIETIPLSHHSTAKDDADTDTDTDTDADGWSLTVTSVSHLGLAAYWPIDAPGLVYGVDEARSEAGVVNELSQGEEEVEEFVEEFIDGPVPFPSFSHAHMGRALPPGPWADSGQVWRGGGRLPEAGRVPPLHLFLLHRFDELLGALRADAMPPVLLATPTLDNGHLDPEVLVDRLEACAEAGVEPLPADLAQALVRLPRGAHPVAAGRAAKVDSAAGRAAAEWLAGDGMPDPVAGFEWVSMSYPGDRRLRPVLRAATSTGHRLIDEVLLATPKGRTHGEFDDLLKWYASIVPSHREVASVNYLPYAMASWEYPAMSVNTVRDIVATDGPTGDATAVILGLLLSSVSTDRVIQLMLSLAARDALPAEALGRHFGVLLQRECLKVDRLFEALAELAHAGAPRQVWDILRPLLPQLIPRDGERIPAPVSEAIVFATDVAAWVGAREEIPAITAYAAGRGRSRFARECRRLRDQLASAPN
ncbi:hypothetical protein [Herbidospora cretacea]|uniref:hypothetical protein n=1 Tax=Herbidospora cretacea TaxID=28444 RepID=UPI000772DFAB|nr:hypothetical protein [Herbidospora cretacea]